MLNMFDSDDDDTLGGVLTPNEDTGGVSNPMDEGGGGLGDILDVDSEELDQLYGEDR